MMIVKKKHAIGMYACIIAILICANQSIKAQNNAGNNLRATHSIVLPSAPVRPLGIGDQLPSISVNNVLNFVKPTFYTEEYKNKLLIMDFMATSCKSCIEVLPKFDSLQKLYDGKLEIVLVTYEKKERVTAFLEKNKIGKQIKFAFVTEDSVLKSFFPHEYISHVVWVDRGFVKAITRTQYVNASNIQTILEGKPVNWPIKRDITEYDYTQALFDLNASNIPEFSIPSKKYYSAFTAYLPGIPRRFSEQIDSLNQVVRISMINYPIVDMYLKALGQKPRFPSSFMILEVKDLSRYVYNSNDNYFDTWRIDNNFSYEACFPISLSREERSRKLTQDLNFYLGLNGRMETRRVECLVLEKKGNTELLTTNWKADEELDIKGSRLTSLSNLLYRLNNSCYSRPVLDHTNLNQRMYLQLTESCFEDLEILQKQLKKYGLSIREEHCEVEMFILSEKDY